MPVVPKHLQAKPPADPRKHPVKGMTYRVRDKDWAEIWGENLSWEDAEKLVVVTVSSLQSRTARTEAEDIACPPALAKAALRARQRAVVAGRVEPIGAQGIAATADTPALDLVELDGHPERCDYSVVWSAADNQHVGLVAQFPSLSFMAPSPPAALVGIIQVVCENLAEVMKKWAEEKANPTPHPYGADRPADHAAAAQLSSIQGGVLSSVAGVAADAQKRADAKQAADKAAEARRLEYVRQREEAERDNKRLAAEADKLDAELDGANVPEGDIDDLIGGIGAPPTDEEIRKAKKKAAEDAAKAKQLR